MDRYFEKNDLKKREKSNIKAELGLRNVIQSVTMPKTVIQWSLCKLQIIRIRKYYSDEEHGIFLVFSY